MPAAAAGRHPRRHHPRPALDDHPAVLAGLQRLSSAPTASRSSPPRRTPTRSPSSSSELGRTSSSSTTTLPAATGWPSASVSRSASRRPRSSSTPPTPPRRSPSRRASPELMPSSTSALLSRTSSTPSDVSPRAPCRPRSLRTYTPPPSSGSTRTTWPWRPWRLPAPPQWDRRGTGHRSSRRQAPDPPDRRSPAVEASQPDRGRSREPPSRARPFARRATVTSRRAAPARRDGGAGLTAVVRRRHRLQARGRDPRRRSARTTRTFRGRGLDLTDAGPYRSHFASSP